MNAVLLGRAEPNTPEWDAMRVNALGGSEIAAVVGLSPWVSRFALWHRKRGTIGKQEVNESMDWGSRLEAAIIDAWLENHPEAKPVQGGTFRSVEHPQMIANPDQLVEGAVLEVKTADKYSAHEWGKTGATGSEAIPPYYYCQIQWYMDVMAVPLAHVAVLIGGNDYREYEIVYSAEDAGWLRSEGEKFWASIEADEQPPIDGSSATYEAIRELHPEIDGTDVTLDPMLWGLYERRDDEAKYAAQELARMKSKVLDAMGTARRGLVIGLPVVRREARGTGKPYLKVITQPKETT